MSTKRVYYRASETSSVKVSVLFVMYRMEMELMKHVYENREVAQDLLPLAWPS